MALWRSVMTSGAWSRRWRLARAKSIATLPSSACGFVRKAFRSEGSCKMPFERLLSKWLDGYMDADLSIHLGDRSTHKQFLPQNALSSSSCSCSSSLACLSACRGPSALHEHAQCLQESNVKADQDGALKSHYTVIGNSRQLFGAKCLHSSKHALRHPGTTYKESQ